MGTGAGAWLLAVPSSDWLQLDDNLFLLALRRRLFLPTPLAPSVCHSCGAQSAEWGHHALACNRSGWLRRRATGLELAWVQVLSEAGANARHRPLLRDLAIPGVMDTDSRQLDIVAGGLPLFGGKTIVGDATLRSPLSGAGVAHSGAANVDGSTFPPARRDKAHAYPELAVDGARHKILVLASEVGGRFSEECTDLVRQLLNLKCARASEGDQTLLRLAYARRWWGILSMAVQRAVSANLHGGDWMPVLGPAHPGEEELLCGVVCPPCESRMR